MPEDERQDEILRAAKALVSFIEVAGHSGSWPTYQHLMGSDEFRKVLLLLEEAIGWTKEDDARAKIEAEKFAEEAKIKGDETQRNNAFKKAIVNVLIYCGVAVGAAAAGVAGGYLARGELDKKKSNDGDDKTE